jgi:hypothetical protein
VALNREEDIRNQIEAWLKQQDISVDREVTCGNGIRADLVTPDMVIEIKKQLNRGTIYQAHGQGVVYQRLLNKPKLLIMGLAPASEAKYQEAQRIAENIRAQDVEVIFMDKDPKWQKTLASITAATVQGIKTSVETPAKAPVKRAGTPASEPRPPVQLPFEKTAASSASPTSAPKPEAGQSPAGQPQRKLGPTIQDVWALLLIVLLFLWVKAAFWRSSDGEFETQPSPDLNPELTVPKSGLE